MEDLHRDINEKAKKGLLIGLAIFFALIFILPFLIAEELSIFSAFFLMSLAAYSGLIFFLKKRIFSMPARSSIVNLVFMLAVCIGTLCMCVYGAFAPFIYPENYEYSNMERGFSTLPALITIISVIIFAIKSLVTKLLITIKGRGQ